MTATPMPLEVPREHWKSEALRLIEARASTGQPFTADDLRADGLGEPPHPNMWGPVFTAAHRLGITTRVGYTQSRHKARAHGVHAVWVGTTFTQATAA